VNVRWLAIVAASAAVASVCSFGVAEATSSFPPGTIHGCIAGTARTLEHVYTNPSKGLTCPSGSSSVYWDQLTTAGSNGLDVITVWSGSPSAGLLNCPSSHPYAVGGGGVSDTLHPLVQSRPIGAAGTTSNATDPAMWNPPNVAEGWLVGNQNGSPVQDAYVICAK
jgi:hypothetical protein